MKYRIVKVTMGDGSHHYIVQRRMFLVFWCFIPSSKLAIAGWGDYHGYIKFQSIEGAQQAVQNYLEDKKKVTIQFKEVVFKTI